MKCDAAKGSSVMHLPITVFIVLSSLIIYVQVMKVLQCFIVVEVFVVMRMFDEVFSQFDPWAKLGGGYAMFS